MNITLTGTKIMQDTKFLAFEKNNGVDVINITVDTDESWTYKLDVKYPDKCCRCEQLYNIINLTRNGNVCTAVLTKAMLPFTGKYIMQLRAINSDKVQHSDTFDAWVKYSIEPSETYNPVPSEFYQIENNITEMNNNPPYPSDDGYWMIWDTDSHDYKKSDIQITNDSTAADVRMQVAGGYIQYSTDGGANWNNLIAMEDLIGAPGKTAYDYAVDAGYTGTEAEFSARMAAEIPTVDGTLTQSGQAADAKATGDAIRSLSEEIATLQTVGLTTEQVNALDGMFKVCAFTKADVSAEYTAFKTAFGIADSGDGGETDVTLTSISATYSGGDVAVGTAVADLTGIVVTAHYSDGTSKAVTGYTLDGTIAEGENTVTVIYGGKMTEFVVVGVAESGGEVTMLSYIESDGGQYIDTEVVPTFDLRYEFGYQMVKDENLTYNSYESSNNIFGACQYASNDAGSYGFMSIHTLNNGVYMNFQSTRNGVFYNYNGNTPYFEQQIMHVVGSYVKNDDGTILQQLQAFTDEAHTNEPAHRDGTTTISVAAQASKIMPIIPLHLFKVNVAPGGYYKDSRFPAFVGKIAYFKVYDDVTGNLLHEFRAAKQNGVGGMYDTVTGKFHGNLGTGAFTLGEEVTA